MKSPCINKCELKCNICVGCKRTLEEIKNWSISSNEFKKAVLKRIKSNKIDINLKDE